MLARPVIRGGQRLSVSKWSGPPKMWTRGEVWRGGLEGSQPPVGAVGGLQNCLWSGTCRRRIAKDARSESPASELRAQLL